MIHRRLLHDDKFGVTGQTFVSYRHFFMRQRIR
jgi:hypothetical protein